LLSIIAIAVLTTAVPYLMYYTGLWIPAATTNEGILLQEPVLIDSFDFRKADGSAWDLAAQEPRFRLFFPVIGECDEVCRDNIYLVRQVDTRLGKDGAQVERIYLQLGEQEDAELRELLEAEYPRMIYLRGEASQWREALAGKPEIAARFDGHEYYLSHRYGALAMAYNEEHSGNQLLEDLKFLIRTSN